MSAQSQQRQIRSVGFDWLSHVTDVLYIVYSPLLTHDSMTGRAGPRYHLVICQALKGAGPGDLLRTCVGPSKSSFLPTFARVWRLQESRRGSGCCHSGPWHRTSARSQPKAGF